MRLAAEHGDRRGHGAGRAHGVLELARDREVARARQAVGDDRRLQRDDGPARVERLADRLAEREHYRRRRRKSPPTAAMPPPMHEAGHGRADEHLLLVLARSACASR